MKIRTKNESGNHLRELLIKGEPVSSLRVIDFQTNIGSVQVRTGGIKGVETREKHKEKGYMRKLMENSLLYMEDEGYDVSMLFGIPNFYTKFGYAPCLPSHKLTISIRDAEEAKSNGGDYKIRKVEKEDSETALQLHNENNQTRTGSIVRTKNYFSGFPRWSPNYSWRYQQPTEGFLVENNKGELLAYAVFDKSKQEVNVVEIESTRNEVFPALLHEFAKMAIERRCGHITLLIPPDHPFAGFCHRYGCELLTRYPKNDGGMMRIINQETLFKKIRGKLEERISDSRFRTYSSSLEIRTDLGNITLNICDGTITIHSQGKQENFLALPQTRLIQLVIGYRGVRDILNDPEVEVRGDIEPLLGVLFPETNPYTWTVDQF